MSHAFKMLIAFLSLWDAQLTAPLLDRPPTAKMSTKACVLLAINLGLTHNHFMIHPLILGTFFEYFDFVLFASFSIIVLPTLLPFAFKGHYLVLAGFWSRPLFALIWDYCAHRWPHHQTLKQNVFLMSGATLGMALLPFDSWPQSSLIALFVFRLAQVAAFSSQFPTALYLLSHTHQQSIHWLYVATALGAVFANLSVFLIEQGLPWRLPFIISAFMLLKCTKIPKITHTTHQKSTLIHHFYLLPFALGVIIFQLVPTFFQSPPIMISQSLLLVAIIYPLIKHVFKAKTPFMLLSCLCLLVIIQVMTQHSFWALVLIQVYLCWCFEVLLVPYTQKISKKYLTTSYQISFLSCSLLITGLI
ncbi:hypothetical protein N9C31_04355 [Gammaproteobacteria bacterium]|nr:hypothetical protein [Gammaproteobacteria bacterium]